MTNFFNWLAMHGYATYIWSAYGIVAFVLVLNIWLIKRQGTRVRQLLSRWFVS